MRISPLVLAAALWITAATAQSPAPPPSPGEVAARAPASQWIAIPPEDLLVMVLAPAPGTSTPRRVVVQLMPAPVAAPWVANIRTLAAAHWWDGTSVNRVQDNYVAQWGDATEKKPVPTGLATVPASDYEVALSSLSGARTPVDSVTDPRGATHAADPYAPAILWYRGFPLATDRQRAWPVHCYASVGVGRNLAPDTGSGAELYAVIGHAPRHLDRNIAVVGRVVEGMEYLSSLPRGTGDLGFYEKEGERVPIYRVRLASELPPAERPRFAYLSTEGSAWADYASARRNREPPFFNLPAGNADVCNIPVPVKHLP